MYRLTLLATLALAPAADAGTLLVDDDFRHFAATGFAPGGAAGALDSDLWRVTGASDGDSAFGDTRLGGDLGRGLSRGGVRSGGIYAFELPQGARGLGWQATGSDFTPGSITRRARTDPAEPLESLMLEWDLWVLNDGDRATRVVVEAASGFDVFQWVPALELVTTAAAGPPRWERQSLLTRLPVDAARLDGGFALRWSFDDASGTGNRDEVAIAGLRVLGRGPDPGEPVPLSGPGSLLCAASGLVLATSGRRRLRIVNAPARPG